MDGQMELIELNFVTDVTDAVVDGVLPGTLKLRYL